MYPEQDAQKIKMLKAASDTMHALVNQTKELQKENQQLRQELEIAKAASSEKVTLKKVASVSEEDALHFSSLLVSHSILPESELQKCAAACMEDPNNAIKIAIHALKSSELPEETGHGIKSASFRIPTKEELKSESDRLYGACFRTANY